MTQQAEVVDTNPEPQQASGEVENAQDDTLDSLLAEYQEPKEEPKQEPQQTAQTSPDVEAFMARQIKRENDQAINDAAKLMQETVGKSGLTEKWFKGQLYLAGAEDDRIMKAFEDRENSPSRWNAVVKELANDLAKDLSIDQNSTESWNAVESAVHSTSTSKPVEREPDWSSMSDAEFQREKMKLG